MSILVTLRGNVHEFFVWYKVCKSRKTTQYNISIYLSSNIFFQPSIHSVSVFLYNIFANSMFVWILLSLAKSIFSSELQCITYYHINQHVCYLHVCSALTWFFRESNSWNNKRIEFSNFTKEGMELLLAITFQVKVFNSLKNLFFFVCLLQRMTKGTPTLSLLNVFVQT